MQSSNLKIVTLVAENVKRLKAVEITPTGNVVNITGANGQGKTTVLDSIWWAIAGTTHIQKQPIRRGANKAIIKLDMGELIVTRTFTEGASKLTLESADGARFQSPQKMLDALRGEISFDPLEFSRMDDAKQYEALRRVSKLDVDIDLLARQHRGAFDRRTELNRDAKAKRAAAGAVTMPAEPVPDTLVDENAIIDRMEEAGNHNALIERIKAERKNQASVIAQRMLEAQGKQERAAALRESADLLDGEAAGLEKEAGELAGELARAAAIPEAIDTTAIRGELEAAKQTNMGILAVKRWRDLQGEATALEQAAAELTEKMAANVKARDEAIARAAMPVPGLGFGEAGITYNGLPFDQASDAEKLQVSLGIAIAANPRLRVICIRDGSLLDDESLATVGRMAREADCQVWIERVDTSGKIGIVIEDGMVAAVNDDDNTTFDTPVGG